jgi:hypothetical protein
MLKLETLTKLFSTAETIELHQHLALGVAIGNISFPFCSEASPLEILECFENANLTWYDKLKQMGFTAKHEVYVSEISNYSRHYYFLCLNEIPVHARFDSVYDDERFFEGECCVIKSKEYQKARSDIIPHVMKLIDGRIKSIQW